MSLPPHAATPSPAVPAEADQLAGCPVRWGVVGAGAMAATFAAALATLEGHELACVGARDGARAARFAATHGCARHCEGYDEVYADEAVDVVYVATTHPEHLGQAKAAIEAGKAVLVEKPLTLNAEQAREVFDLARRRGVFAMEAMWLRTQPLLCEVARLVQEGTIGDLVHVSAEFAVSIDYAAEHRLFDLGNGGGALLDLGVYPAAFVWMFLGEPDSVQVMGSLAATGADQVVAMQWGYETGAVASIFTSSQAAGPNRACLIGRRGWIELAEPFWRSPGWAVVHVDGEADRRIDVPSEGYAHQAVEVERCLRAGVLESPLMPHADTIGVLEILDAARSELGVRYPQE